MTFAEKIRNHKLVCREIRQAAENNGCTIRVVGEREVEVTGDFLAVHRTRIEAMGHLSTVISMESIPGSLTTYNLREV